MDIPTELYQETFDNFGEVSFQRDDLDYNDESEVQSITSFDLLPVASGSQSVQLVTGNVTKILLKLFTDQLRP